MKPVQAKQGKSKRGKWSAEQRAFVDRAISFGCLWCYCSRGIEGTPASWHHQKEGYHGAGMRAPHEQGVALCERHHKGSLESIHLAPRQVKDYTGFTEGELVKLSQEMFNWSGVVITD